MGRIFCSQKREGGGGDICIVVGQLILNLP